jgi:putative ABC transport system permease protein
MNVSRNLVLSFEIFAAHKLRTVLSVLGIVVGVGAVVLMVAAGRGAEERILGTIRSMGTNLIVVSAGQTRLVAGRQRQFGTEVTLVPGDADAITAQCPAVELAASMASKKMSVRWDAENTNTKVFGIATAGFRVRNIVVESGRLFGPEEDRARSRVAVLGPTVVRNLLGDVDPIGLRIRIGRIPFEVIGVTKPKGVDANGLDQDDLVYVPLRTAMRRLLNVAHVEAIYVRARSAGILDEGEEQIRELLRRRHRLREKPDDFTIQNQAVLLATERETARSVTLLIGSVAGISLLVGGVGILAVMLISVRERTREIGLRRAIGASRGDIRTQFLLESGLLATVGGVLGVLVGVAAAMGASALGDWETSVSWPVTATALGFSFFVGVVFGSYPAMRAARLEPVDALRG